MIRDIRLGDIIHHPTLGRCRIERAPAESNVAVLVRMPLRHHRPPFFRGYQAQFDEVLFAWDALAVCPCCRLSNGWHKNHCKAPDSPDAGSSSECVPDPWPIEVSP